jgi:RNAse (barnase) inhibitor barstar
VDQELNYVNYFTEIERFFQSKRESFTTRLSPLDWVLVENWKDQGVPLDIVLKGIDRAFSRARRKIGSLAYCIRAVEEVLEEHKELRVGPPSMPAFEEEEIREYLAKLADAVAAVDESIAAGIRSAGMKDLRSIEQTLSALEEKLIAKLKFTTADAVMIHLRQEIDAELNPLRQTMPPAQLALLEQQMWRRKLLERHRLPRLSLFYLI